jgi:hypothetical protein
MHSEQQLVVEGKVCKGVENEEIEEPTGEEYRQDVVSGGTDGVGRLGGTALGLARGVLGEQSQADPNHGNHDPAEHQRTALVRGKVIEVSPDPEGGSSRDEKKRGSAMRLIILQVIR